MVVVRGKAEAGPDVKKQTKNKQGSEFAHVNILVPGAILLYTNFPAITR